MSDIEFSEQELERIGAWFAKRPAPCVTCKGTKWTVEPHRLGLVVPQSLAKMKKIGFVPVVLLACDSCGLVQLFSVATILGSSEDG